VSKWRLGQLWDGCEWLHSSVVLNKGKFPFILASSKTCVAITWPDASLHLSPQKFKATVLPAFGPHHVGTSLIQSTPSKKLSKMAGNLSARFFYCGWS